MMQKALGNMRRITALQARAFSYNYLADGHQRVYLEVARDGQNQGRMVFELFDSQTPEMAENFAAFCTGQAQGNRSYVGTSLNAGVQGHGVCGGRIDDENLNAANMRGADENLEMRHHTRGILTMTNDGPNSNGSEFMVTFGEANYLNGYHNVVGQLVEGDHLLSQIEDSCNRRGNVSGSWQIVGCGHHH